MNNAVIIHGSPSADEMINQDYPSPSNSHWIPWLQKQLIINGILAQAPEMPDAASPDYEAWKRILEFFPLNSSTLLIGHSTGAAFLLRYLSENKITVSMLILIAPFLDPFGYKATDFFHFRLDRGLNARIKPIHLLYSADDPDKGVKESAESIIKILPNINIHYFMDQGHFTSEDMDSDEFPQLLNLIIPSSA